MGSEAVAQRAANAALDAETESDWELAANKWEEAGHASASRKGEYMQRAKLCRDQVADHGAGETQTPYVLHTEAAREAQLAGRFAEAALEWRAAADVGPTAFRDAMLSRALQAEEKATAFSEQPGTMPVPARDARLPPPGSTFRKTFRDGRHIAIQFFDGPEVKVTECDQPEFVGQTFPSVSGLGRAYTGRNTNGYLWLGLKEEVADRDSKPQNRTARIANLCRRASALLAELASEIEREEP